MENKPRFKNVILRCGADKILPMAIVYMFYIILHGHLSPGGGFQGGVLIFMSILYVAAAMLGIAYLGNFCQNVFSDIGNIGDLFSSGTIFIMDTIVGLKVLTGVGVLAITMLGLLMVKGTDEKE